MVLAGQTIEGTYQLTRLVGEGGMGMVYEATHARLAGRYAIKVLLRELSDSPEARACFDREARITSLVQHPNVVQVIDHNTTADGTSYLVMEYLSGESLAQRLARDGRLPARAVADIVDQIAAGLAAAHARGIVHRDLKPDNVFLVPVEGRATALVKLLDFGISKASWCRETSDQNICGTPQYMAPEQAEGRARDVDPATDQYALAVIAHELLTGENPFAGESVADVLARVLGGVVPPTGVSPALDAMLARALSQSNGDRFASVTAFAEAFRAAAVPVEVAAAAAPVATTRVRRTRPRRWGGGAGLGLAAAAAIVSASFVGTGAANRAARPPNVATVPSVAAETAKVETIAENVPETAEPELRAPVRRARRARIAERARDDGPAIPIPIAARRRAAPAALGPDEDATMAPSEF